MKRNKILLDNKVFEMEIANSFFSRLKGLLGVNSMKDTAALLIKPCSSIHTFGMKFPITAIFIDKNYKITDVKENMKVNRIFASLNKNTKMVLEISYTGNENINIIKGQKIFFIKDDVYDKKNKI